MPVGVPWNAANTCLALATQTRPNLKPQDTCRFASIPAHVATTSTLSVRRMRTAFVDALGMTGCASPPGGSATARDDGHTAPQIHDVALAVDHTDG